ncbi:Zn-dependent hydrolase [Nitratireductor alexandrii]|uniref:Zn-dependent hydrolase n=1 Tax=Nitratireductor alexandrii TaxID=2448161 RepID=UPI000FDCACE7|nr:Zn-dependent hydrolase [Nitratireductor alexandrii]
MTARRTNLPVDGGRLWADLMALGTITEPDKPYTRRSFSPLFLEGRDWLAKRFAAAGLSVRIDTGGNLIGRMEGARADAGTIMIGSHSDTVPAGGRFDGVAGVIVALEIARSLREAGRQLDCAIEIVDFLAEEPSEFGLSCVGSRALTGRLTDEQLGYRDPTGERLDQAIGRVGGDPARLAAARRDDIVGFFELHIEQGIVLEQQGIDLGIVTAIAGIARVEIVFDGRADHAGTTPMDLRRDAGLAAAITSAFVASTAREAAAGGNGHFVATTGVFEQFPNAANVVPGKARLVVDIRAEDHAVTERFLAALDARSGEIAAECRVERARFALLSDTDPAPCDTALQALLSQSADALGYSSLPMASGAGHDAAFMSHIAPSAMVFVPCRDGRSHAPEEWAEPDAIAAGAAVIHDAVLRLDERHNKTESEGSDAR